MQKHIQGSIVALVTPMHEDGSLDLGSFDRLVDWHVEAGTSAIVVVGTTGESATLTAQEHCDLVAHCVETARGRLPIIAGTGSNNTAEAVYFTESARAHGADACLLVTPYYNKPSQEGLFQHFRALAEAVAIPQILYNVPGRTAGDMSVETTVRLAQLDNIVGIKDASGDIARGLELREACPADFAVYSGEDAISLPLILGGGQGTISVTANVAPDLMAQMCTLALAGDTEGAKRVDDRLRALHESLFLEANPVPVKWALAKMGMIERGIRLPLVELDANFHIQVCDALAQAGIQLPVAA